MTFPDFFIFFIEQLFLIFNQMLSIRAFGRRDVLYKYIHVHKKIISKHYSRTKTGPKHAVHFLTKKIKTYKVNPYAAVSIDALHPSQQFFSHVGTSS